MTTGWKLMVFGAVSVAVTTLATVANAQTASEIVASVIDELDNINDFTATVSSDYDVSEIPDVTNSSFRWKRPTSGAWKEKLVAGSPANETIVTDGSGGWNYIDPDDQYDVIYFSSTTTFQAWTEQNGGYHLYNMHRLLAASTWTKDANTSTVNGVECYRLYTTLSANNLEIWVDVATMKKVIRSKQTDANNALIWESDYTDYSSVESVAQLPSTFVQKRYVSGSVSYTVTHTLSAISVNDALSNSLFTIQHP